MDADVRRWVEVAIEAANDKLGQRTEAYFVGDVMGITDWFIVTSGNNPRQVRAIVDNVEEELFLSDGPKAVRVEGKETMQWVLADFGAFVLHVFDEENREYYDLDRLWSDVPKFSA